MLLMQILRLNNTRLFIYSLTTLAATTFATVAALYVAGLWQGDVLQTTVKFTVTYLLLMYGYYRVSLKLTA